MKNTLCALLLLAPFTAFSQNESTSLSNSVQAPKRSEFSVGLGALPYYQNNDGLSGPNARAIFTSFSWRTSPRVSLGFRPFYIKAEENFDGSHNRFYGTSFFYRYDFIKKKRINVFADASMGFASMRSNRTSFQGEAFEVKDIAFIANVGLGVEYKISARWSAFAMLQYVHWNYDLSNGFAKGFMPIIGVKYRIR